jgi:hypothetical protein
MKARIGGCVERWDGREVLVLHVFPVDSDEALYEDAVERLGGEKRRSGDPRPTLCGERHPMNFGWLEDVPPPPGARWCPECKRLDSGTIRLPG